MRLFSDRIKVCTFKYYLNIPHGINIFWVKYIKVYQIKTCYHPLSALLHFMDQIWYYSCPQLDTPLISLVTCNNDWLEAT